MSQKNRNPGGRPKGYPKTGGRKKGTPNKSNVRLRERFAQEGFDFVREMMTAMKDAGPETRLAALLKLAPFFMQRLREDTEAPGDVPPEPEDSQAITTEQLLKLVTG